MKNQRFLSLGTVFLVFFSFTALFTSCDMVYVEDPANAANAIGKNKILSEAEKDYLEKNGHYLKLTCLPSHAQSSNVFSTSVANSFSTIAKLDKNTPVFVYKESNFTSSVYITLSYNDDSDFVETGHFYVAFNVHVDAVKKYVVELADKVLVEFIDGRGTYDVRNIPQVGSADIHYLTIFNLPSGFVSQSISNVFVNNMYDPIAKCKDYSLIELISSDDTVTIKIPLHYINGNSVFNANGSFFVGFELYYDAFTHFSITAEERIAVNFVNGNGYLDISNFSSSAKGTPYLTITGLPINTTKKHFSNIAVYNMNSSVANCSDNNNIIVIKEVSYSTALIPLTAGDDYFRDTGVFIVTFKINVDALTQLEYTRNDTLMLDFYEGSASFNLLRLGFFDASLINPSDLEAPIIKINSSFDINGFTYKAKNDIEINSFLPSYSGIVYVYAYRNEDEVFFEYSPVVPDFNESKNGYYVGNKRALFKFFLIAIPPSTPTGSPQYYYVAKENITVDWNNLHYFNIDNPRLIEFFSNQKPAYALSGENDPPPETFTLDPGIYIVNVVGAGGGSSFDFPEFDSYSMALSSSFVESGSSSDNTSINGVRIKLYNNDNISNYNYSDILSPYQYTPVELNINFNTSIQGGNGGSITELVFVTSPTTFTAYTGSGGKSSTLPHYQGYEKAYTIINNLSSSKTAGGSLASGGGGGGSGTFLYTDKDNNGYFACAGGGAGAPGVSSLSPGGGGGIGGSIGSGSGGGGSGLFIESIHSVYFEPDPYGPGSSSESNYNNYFYSSGGSGGGYRAGVGGDSSSLTSINNGANGYYFLNLSPSLFESYPSIRSSFNLTNVHYSLGTSYNDTFINQYSKRTTKSVTSLSSTHGGAAGSAYFLRNPFNTESINGRPENTPTLPKLPLFVKNSTYSSAYSLAEKTDQRDGGNNRNSLRGNGAKGGSKLYFYDAIKYPTAVFKRSNSNGDPGSITIYKIQ